MKSWSLRVLAIAGVMIMASGVTAETVVVGDRNMNETARSGFGFKSVPAPSKSDAASKATVTIVDGRRDRNGGDADVLTNGRMPTSEDQPRENFFFAAGTDGGRLLIDLGKEIEVKQVNTYSWHPNTRGPQVYTLYVSEGKGDGFNEKPTGGTDPTSCGWKLLAKVDTRAKEGADGGQYGVSISDSQGNLGKFRYLLFDISKTEDRDGFGNTFFSEIDVVDPTSEVVAATEQVEQKVEVIEADGGKYRITIDTTGAPDLTQWAHEDLAPVVKVWYPKIVDMLPSEGYEAPKSITITISDSIGGVAATSGTRIGCSAGWFRGQLNGEAKGAVVHELVHAVQQFGRARRVRGATRTPGWLVEGMADYIRWFLYEPETGGAEIMTRRSLSRARYDGSYRVSGNFLNWAVQEHDKDLLRKVNAAAREGRYVEDIWKRSTGLTLEELGEQWKQALAAKIEAREKALANLNTLTDAEKAAGWKLLFDGKSFEGWSNFKRDSIRKGWQVKDGAMVCADPHDAGDLCTKEQFDWFELKLEYNISHAGNSGIMYHVTEDGGAAWATGPEFQLEDNTAAADPVRCGWLYALYQPPIDPKTGKTLDATKPVGQWNQVRLVISKDKCFHEINGVRYFEYVLGSEDFKERVAKSKFSRMPLFAKFDKGMIALQGDHGQVSFRNVKIRPIKTER